MSLTQPVKMTRMLLALSLLAGVFALFLTAQSAHAQAATGKVRVAHLSPDAPAVDIYVDGNKVLNNVAFKAVSSYLPVPAGQHRFEVRPAGAAASTKAVIDANANIEAGKDYTVAAINTLDKIQPLVLVDDNTTPGAGKAKVRVVHASPDAPAVDVAVKGGPVLINNLAFGKASDTLTVDAKTYDLEVRPTGTTTVALPLNGVSLNAGNIYTVFAADKVANLTPVVAAVPAAQGGATPTAAPATGFGGTAQDNLTFGLVAILTLALVAGLASFGLWRRSVARK
ncbi:MAG TPA: DUF4397 domain-containing protein [Chloroflexia bacterium]|nr:DUF4397 domain-containing protein [Chloroflexia bacterium]